MDKHAGKLPGALAILSVLLLGAALRIFNLGGESLWIDEGNSLRDASVQTIARQSKPLYYAVLSLWMRLGESEAMLRLLSVLFGLVSIYLIYLLGKELISRKAGTIAALFAAVSPLMINHSQEVRMYTMLLMIALAMVYFFVRLVSGWDRLSVAGFIVTSALALLTHPVAALLLFSLNLVFLLNWRQVRLHWRVWTLCHVIIFAIWAFWLPHVLGFGTYAGEWQMPGEALSLRWAPMFWSWFMMGEWNRLVYPDKLPLRYAHHIYAYMLLAIMLLAIILRRKHESTPLLAIWLTVPLILMLILTVLTGKTWVPRYLIYSAPAVYLLVAACLCSVRRNLAIIALVCIIMLPLFRLNRYYANTMHAEWRPAVQFLESRTDPDDFIGVYKPSNQHVFAYYYRGQATWEPLARMGDCGSQFNWEPEDSYQAVRSLPTDRYSWLVDSRIPEEAMESIEQEIAKQGRLIEHKKYFEIDLYLLAPVDRQPDNPSTKGTTMFLHRYDNKDGLAESTPPVH